MKGYRTILVMVVAAIPPVVDLMLPILQLPQWQTVIPDQWWAIYSLAISILGVFMRKITTGPVGSRV